MDNRARAHSHIIIYDPPRIEADENRCEIMIYSMSMCTTFERGLNSGIATVTSVFVSLFFFSSEGRLIFPPKSSP